MEQAKEQDAIAKQSELEEKYDGVALLGRVSNMPSADYINDPTRLQRHLEQQ